MRPVLRQPTLDPLNLRQIHMALGAHNAHESEDLSDDHSLYCLTEKSDYYGKLDEEDLRNSIEEKKA
jgi:hypothetical protein